MKHKLVDSAGVIPAQDDLYIYIVFLHHTTFPKMLKPEEFTIVFIAVVRSFGHLLL